MKYGLWAVIIAVLAISGTFVFAALHYSKASDVSTALAAITGTIGTILGAYLGVQTGAAGPEAARRDLDEHFQRSEEERARAEANALHYASLVDPSNRQLDSVDEIVDAMQRATVEERVRAIEIADSRRLLGGVDEEPDLRLRGGVDEEPDLRLRGDVEEEPPTVGDET
jgi:hypothetical protein